MFEQPTIPKRSEILDECSHSGQRIIAVFPIHYHRALLRAHDLLPIEVWGPAGYSTTNADAHLQAYVCSIARCGLSFALDGGLNKARAILVPHSCDSLQGLGSVFLDFIKPKTPVLTLYVPRARREADTEFLARELRALDQKLSQISGQTPSHAQLHSCIDAEQRADELMDNLLKNRMKIPMSNYDFYRLLRSRQYVAAQRFAKLANSVLESADDHIKDNPHRVIISGIVPEPMELLSALDDAGLTIVWDDTACIGRRIYPQTHDDDPYVRMAKSMLTGPADPELGSSIGDRTEYLLNLTRKYNAHGLVFWSVKFCEPELFHIPQVSQALGMAGIRTLFLEVDISEPSTAQVLTRLEAFAESL